MPAADTVMLSETTDGDYLVRRFIVKRPGDTDYSVRYQINPVSYTHLTLPTSDLV